MKTLIVEDDFNSRQLLHEQLKSYGPSHLAGDGEEAVEAARLALEAGEPYQLICLDILMPRMDGHQALGRIRALEEARGVSSTHGAKIVMTTALGDLKNACAAFRGLCDAYLVKPIDHTKLRETLRQLALIN